MLPFDFLLVKESHCYRHCVSFSQTMVLSGFWLLDQKVLGSPLLSLQLILPSKAALLTLLILVARVSLAR